MLKKRIIPCLDIKDGRTVKGIRFKELRDAGDPVELARNYAEESADELVFLDISASIEARKTTRKLVRDIALEINIPFTVGGGISSLSDAAQIIESGADKISLNSAAIHRPELISEVASEFGCQCVVLAVDFRKIDDDYYVYTHGGTWPTGLKLFNWLKTAESCGIGELLLTSMDHDGTRNGFALDLYKSLKHRIQVPLIASGGAGSREDFSDVFRSGAADAALAASVFHYGNIRIPELKNYLKQENIAVRCM